MFSVFIESRLEMDICRVNINVLFNWSHSHYEWIPLGLLLCVNLFGRTSRFAVRSLYWVLSDIGDEKLTLTFPSWHDLEPIRSLWKTLYDIIFIFCYVLNFLLPNIYHAFVYTRNHGFELDIYWIINFDLIDVGEYQLIWYLVPDIKSLNLMSWILNNYFTNVIIYYMHVSGISFIFLLWINYYYFKWIYEIKF